MRNEVQAPKPVVSTAVAMMFVIIALLAVLMVLGLRGKLPGTSVPTAELTQLQAEANALRDQLNRERMAIGLRPLESSGEPVDEIAARLKRDADTMVAMAGSMEAMLIEKDALISATNADLISAKQSLQALAAESARLQAELQRALVSSSEVDVLRSEVGSLKSQREALANELANVRAQLAAKGEGVPAEKLADAERQLEETRKAKDFFEARVAELERQLSQARLFASNENELLPAAVKLFRSLRDLENKTDSEIATAYSSLGASIGVNVLHTLNFETGSSELTPDNQNQIRDLVGEIPDGDLVLVIGYASETGNVDNNRTLSSARATAAAQLFTDVKRPGQQVQAVYLGQTDRFSSRIPERNQIVEIWRIRKQ